MSNAEIGTLIHIDPSAAAVMASDGYVYSPHELIEAARQLHESHPTWTWDRVAIKTPRAARANRSRIRGSR